MVCAIKFDADRKIKFDLNVLNTNYDVFSKDSGFGIMTRAKNVLTALKNANNDNAKTIVLGADVNVLNNANGVIANAIIDNNGVITLNGVNITGASIVENNGVNRAVNNVGDVINEAVINGVNITLGNVIINNAHANDGAQLNDDGKLLQHLIDDINANASAKTILGRAANDNIGDHNNLVNLRTRLTENDNRLLNNILDKLPELERVLHKSSSKNRTEYILYRMIDNMIKSIYGTIILIIQAHSKENQNIYTLLGSSRRRLQGGV